MPKNPEFYFSQPQPQSTGANTPVYIVLWIVNYDPPGLHMIDWTEQLTRKEHRAFLDLEAAIDCAKENKGVVYEASKCWDYFEDLSQQKEDAEKAEYQRLKQKYEESV